jgi:hypothetical protein
MIRLRRVSALLLCVPALLGQGRPAPDERSAAKSWVGRYQEVEDYLRAAECVNMETFVPNRLARCTLRSGGPVARMAWKALPPGLYRGFRESYKAEIAAYQVDRLLKTDMVPPTVERRLDDRSGAAQLWVENAVTLKANEAPDASVASHWEQQLSRMATFDALIGNRDRGAGNTLRDSAWNVILIDHSRAFPASSELPFKLARVDEALWQRILALTRTQLDAVLRAWLSEDEIRAILGRRERMKAELKSVRR